MHGQHRKDPRDAAVADLARGQHGVVSRDQLVGLGLGADAVDWRVRRRRLHRVHRGVYAVGHLSLTRNGRYMAAVLACGEGAALSHFSAAVLWELLRDRGWPIHVTAATDRRRPGIRVHKGDLEGERVRREGITVTTPARTLVDLADVAPRRLLERAIDEADYLGLDTDGLEPRRGRRGQGVLSSVLAVHTPGATRTRSELEERFLALCDEHGIERPEVNVDIEGYECDFVWREQALVVETDGGAAHGTARARERDRIKDARLLLAGWRVVRVTWMRLLNEPGQVARELNQLLTQARFPAARVARRRQ
ncbi:MAG TPA: type IV toxin-antitoxin system AbiEi family antitoxin domain-containing protein [Thermoleophilaceae bacterium]|nr:type IV toxin-antitoxin system AbiEi family antitoxin domain-containing protein [Thermoleophilaceae bacterium]